MAGSLIKIDEEIVTSAVASVTLTGIDSTYDVYMARINNVTGATDGAYVRTRFTVSGSADTSSNYDRAAKELKANATFGNSAQTNQDGFNFVTTGNGTSETSQIVFYLFNFNNASEYSFATFEEATFDSTNVLKGRQGGGVLTVAQATDGINFFMSSGNISSGTFTLYGLKK